MTSFNLEEAIQLRNLLHRFRETHQYEWSVVIQQWENLKYSWQDVHYYDFEQDFQKLIHDQDNILKDIEQQLQLLEQSILIVERMNTTLTICGLSSMGIKDSQQPQRQSLKSNVVPPSQTAASSTSPETVSQRPQEQSSESNVVPPSQTTASSTSTEADSTPQTSGQKSSDFAMSLKFNHYRHRNGGYRCENSDKEFFGTGDHGRIEAVQPDERETKCYIVYVVDQQNRVKISNIDVPEAYQRQGIGRQLFRDLEKRCPSGTTFFFTENKREEFWKAMGFQKNVEANEYYYVKM
jgi:ribosomal protein S18 acetylase RimI-like enzyme